MSQTEPLVPKSGHWIVPREWEGERCWIIGGGASVKDQARLIPQLKGRIIAIKQAVALRPDADVMFLGGKDDPRVCREYFPLFKGQYIITRGWADGFPTGTKWVGRYGAHKGKPAAPQRLSHDPRYISGWDAGASAINLAYLFGAGAGGREFIGLLGFDMTGNRWVKKHHLPVIPRQHHAIHRKGHTEMAADLKAAGVRVVNFSPISALDCYERGRLEDFV